MVGGGCSGFSYELGWEDAQQEGDQIVESSGVKVYVDPNSVQYVGGVADRLRRQPVRLRLLDQQPQLQGLLRLRPLLPGLIPAARGGSGLTGGGVRVPVALFARYREAVGRGRVEVEVGEGATVEDVWTALTAAHPVLTRYRPHTLFAVGTDYVEASHPVHAGEEVACFPPVSGGSA